MSTRASDLILTVLVSSAIAGVSPPPTGQAGGVSGAQLSLSTTAHDLGRLSPADIRRAFQITIRNTGTQTLEIRKVRTSCTCLRAELSRASISRDGQATLSLHVEPSTIDDFIEEEILVYSNDPARPVGKIRVTGSIGADIRLVPHTVFSVGIAYRSALADVLIPPTELVAADKKPLGQVRVTASHPSITPLARRLDDHRYELSIKLDKSAPLGTLKESIRVETDHPTQPIVDVPIIGSVGGDLDTAGRRIDFGLIREQQAASVTFRLQNRGGRPVDVVRSEIALLVPAKVEVTKEAQAVFKIVVGVPPSPAFTRLDGHVHLHTDHPDEPLVRIPVSGGVLADRPFEQISTDRTQEEFLAIVKDALARGERVPVDRFFSDVLGGVKDERASALLLRALAEGSVPMRMRAVELLGEFKTQAVLDRLQDTITDDQEPFVRRLAVIAYAEAIGELAVPSLLVALQDDYPWVREDAATYLGKLGDARAIPPLQAALADPDPEAAVAVRNALASIQGRVKR